MKWICYAVCLASVAATADEVYVKATGNGQEKTVALTTNETTCTELFWDGVPNKEGRMSGGHYKITVQMVNDAVIVKESSQTSHGGISSDRTDKTIIPAKKIPWTGTISQTTVTVFCVRQDMNETTTKSPNPQVTAPKVADPGR